MMPYKNRQGKIMDGTVFTAIAVNGENMDSIQLEINNAKEVDILLNGQIFEEENMNNLELDGVYLHISFERYFLQFVNGINIEIKLTQEHDAFFFVTTVPDKFKSKTRGLLGVMDNNISNDFTLPDGTVLKLNATNDREVFYSFGENWRRNMNNTVFTYLDGLSHSNFENLSFVPKFLSDGISFTNRTLEILAVQRCGNDRNCLFDVSTTGELSIGNMSLEFASKIKSVQGSILEAGKACVPLSSIFENGIITSQNGLFEFSCDEKYCLKGEKELKCIDSAYNHVLPECHICSSSVRNIINMSILLTCLFTYFIQFF